MILWHLTTVLAFLVTSRVANGLSVRVKDTLEPGDTTMDDESVERERPISLKNSKWATSWMHFLHQDAEFDEEDRYGADEDCEWAAIGFKKNSNKGCRAFGSTKDEAKSEVNDQGCDKIYTFNEGCAAVAWNKKPYAYGYKRSTSRSRTEIIESAKKRCKGDKDRDCGNYEYECPHCYESVEGRPFVDSGNNVLQAEVRMEDTSSWSKLDYSTDIINPTSSVSVLSSNSMDRQDVGYDWAKRGLGEHASVASFAAVTLALMTNGAPPDLIRDSLLAALDEVNHAQLSFDVASLFLGEAVEPGPLPQSSHKFSYDMTALALGAAREGCVEETLSALGAAAEVDQLELEKIESLGEHKALLRDRVSIIAIDEARHSSLAWRTVRWACSMDADACEVVKQEVFDHKKLSNAAKKRFPSGMVDKAFEEIYESLVPFATGQESHVKLLTALCNAAAMEEGTDDKNMLEAITAKIVKGALCETY